MIKIAFPENFVGYSRFAEISLHKRNLPHWRMDGGTYFVTFRLKDSLPANVIAEMKESLSLVKEKLNSAVDCERENLLENYYREEGRLLDHHLDAGFGSCALRKTEHRDMVSNALLFFDGQRYDMYTFVVMPNHVHILIQPKGGFDLSEILHSWKSFTANKIDSEDSRGLWQPESYDRLIRDPEHYYKAAKYIANNPAKAGLPADDFTLYQKLP